MILPPDTEKEEEALRELLAAPPAARLPPPPYITAQGGAWQSAHAYGHVYAHAQSDRNRASTSSIPYGPSISSGSTGDADGTADSEEGRTGAIPLVDLVGRPGGAREASGRARSEQDVASRTALNSSAGAAGTGGWASRRRAWRRQRGVIWKRPSRRTLIVAGSVLLVRRAVASRAPCVC